MTFKEALRVELKALAPTVAFIVIAHAMIMWVYNEGIFGALGVLLALGAVKMALVLGWTVVKIGAFVAALAAIAYVFMMVF
ncbi:hypothetical protein [Microvirga calopogonii]|uniref:hypothetical protein n=1 Tax=Microvirga calopogonii TaxID=2078013 RepID=UPI000E0CE762|nr:hypothetical protein [Microvirga calopogonii]